MSNIIITLAKQQRTKHSLFMMTDRKRKVIGALDSALNYCGYDLDVLMKTKCRERIFTDLRSIVWAIYQGEMGFGYQQVAIDFGWNRATVFCAIRRANELRKIDRNFSDMYDSVHGAFINAMSSANDGNINS